MAESVRGTSENQDQRGQYENKFDDRNQPRREAGHVHRASDLERQTSDHRSRASRSQAATIILPGLVKPDSNLKLLTPESKVSRPMSDART